MGRADKHSFVFAKQALYKHFQIVSVYTGYTTPPYPKSIGQAPTGINGSSHAHFLLECSHQFYGGSTTVSMGLGTQRLKRHDDAALGICALESCIYMYLYISQTTTYYYETLTAVTTD